MQIHAIQILAMQSSTTQSKIKQSNVKQGNAMCCSAKKYYSSRVPKQDGKRIPLA